MESVKVSFDCAYSSSRYGFNHECTAATSEGRTTFVKCHYINRTWEAHPFDTAKRAAIHQLIDDEVSEYVRAYKEKHHNARLPRNFKRDLAYQIKQKYADALAKI